MYLGSTIDVRMWGLLSSMLVAIQIVSFLRMTALEGQSTRAFSEVLRRTRRVSKSPCNFVPCRSRPREAPLRLPILAKDPRDRTWFAEFAMRAIVWSRWYPRVLAPDLWAPSIKFAWRNGSRPSIRMIVNYAEASFKCIRIPNLLHGWVNSDRVMMDQK